jgi:phosphinothricin acetyltransferase
MSRIAVRPAQSGDLVAVAAIYAHCVRTGTATFDIEEPPLSFWQAKLDSTAMGDHFLVAHSPVAHSPFAHSPVAHSPVADSPVPGDPVAHRPVVGEGDNVLGYAYSGAFRSRPAYRHTREVSVYVTPEASGGGLGTRLYGELLLLLRQDDVHLVVAVVAQPNPASNAMHRRLGFTEVGTLDEVGFKFGAYLSTTYFQLRLS